MTTAAEHQPAAPTQGERVWTKDEQGNITNAHPLTIHTIEAAPSGELFARFVEVAAGWPLAQCEVVRTDPRDAAARDKAMTDAAMIQQTASTLFQPATVVELRILNTLRDGTVSGYFDNSEDFTKAAEAWSGKAPAVYATLNPCNSALLARSANRLQVRAKTTTADHDIVQRVWLPLDFDPVRPAGISSTDAEHAAALQRAVACTAWLTAQGWPLPVAADSGNGGHGLYSIDLPNDDASKMLLKTCLEVLALYFTDSVVRGFGGCAATHVEGTGQPVHFFPAILLGRPWVVVTVPALVLCARWLGWSREEATTSLVTGPVLIPFGRLHPSLSLPPPTAVLHLFPPTGGYHDTPQRLLPRLLSIGPYASAPSVTRALRRPSSLPPPRRWHRHW